MTTTKLILVNKHFFHLQTNKGALANRRAFIANVQHTPVDTQSNDTTPHFGGLFG